MSSDKKQYILTIEAEGQIINHALFVKDVYKDPKGREGTPKYRVEMAYDNEKDLDELYDLCVEAVTAEFGEVDEDDIIFPIIDGNKMAKKREKKGKSGDAYEDRWVIRPSTIFNKHGDDDAGGVAVFDEEVEPISLMDKGQIHRGVFGAVRVQVGVYEDDDSGNPACNLYLKAFQKYREPEEDEKIGGTEDHASAFKPVGRDKGTKRKSRKG